MQTFQSFMSGLNSTARAAADTNATISRTMQGVSSAIDEGMVRKRMNDLLQAAGQQHGGDVTMLDPTMYADRDGLVAMGRIVSQYSQTEQGKNEIMRNNVIQAKHRYGMMQQYMKDIEDAIKSGDQQRVVGLMSNAGSLSGVPYRFTPTEDGQLAVSYVGADGVHDKGTMTMMEAYEQMKGHMASKGRFIRDSVMYGMGVQEDNLERMMNPKGWKFVTDARGNQYTMIPQTIMRNGQYEPGFIVAGAGGTRNMTLDEVSRSGLLGSAGGGLGGVRTPAISKDDLEIIDTASTVMNPETGEKARDPYMAQALTMLTQQVGSADKAMIVLQEWERILSQDAAIAEQLAALPAGQKAMAIIEIMQAQAKTPAKAPASAPVPSRAGSQKGDDKKKLHDGIRDAAKSSNESLGIGVKKNPLAGVSFGLPNYNHR